MTDEELRGRLVDALRLNVNPPIWRRGYEQDVERLLPVVRELCQTAYGRGRDDEANGEPLNRTV